MEIDNNYNPKFDVILDKVTVLALNSRLAFLENENKELKRKLELANNVIEVLTNE